MRATNCKVLLVYPRFNSASFWNYKETCEAVGARHPAAPLGLITVAALLPPDWPVRLIDQNTRELTAEDIDAADLVMTGGMLPQQLAALAVIELCRSRGKPVAVGGPDVTSSPHVYQNADIRVLGEAESVMGSFVSAWNAGLRQGVFEAEKFKTDVTRSPVPRFDLLKFRDYIHVGVQYSRGCPFTCEFCDIIELYGRVPRAKTTPQMLAELDELYALGYRGHVDFVDDNLIGNKKALKQFLPDLIAWQRAHGFPFEFSTEASINLADDGKLLSLLHDANFFAVFVGIESPDADTLVAMQKKQNTRRSLADSVHKIYAAGISVYAGFILGFDSEHGSIAEPMIDCVEATSIPVCMVGLLYALPNTQLTRRLIREGRLHVGHDVAEARPVTDQCTGGLNFETARQRRDILLDYTRVLKGIYDPEAYFARVRRVGRMLKRASLTQRPAESTGMGQPERTRGMFEGVTLFDMKRLARIMWRVSTRHPGLLPHFLRTLHDCLRHNPGAVKSVTIMLALYLHLGPFARQVVGDIERLIVRIERGDWWSPNLVPATMDDVQDRAVAAG
ncbi:MAG: DUF4070 domain-containing protein [Rhizobiales bacterium]|nr:DUF4070 domain-containing protein [Hyphomicrobiales bacterium]